MEIGYKILSVGFLEGRPVLMSPYTDVPWRKSLLRSDWREDKDGSFINTRKGIYSVRRITDLRLHHDESIPSVVAEVIPVGRTVHGDIGYRSEKVLLRTILWDPVAVCEICSKDTPEVLVVKPRPLPNLPGYPVVPPPKLLESYFICKYCYPYRSHHRGKTWEGVMRGIGSRYKVPVIRKVGLMRELLDG